MPPNPLTYFEIRKYYLIEPRFNGVYSRHNLPKIKDGAYVINLEEYKSRGTHWIALYVNDGVTYFDTFGVKYIQKEIKKFISNRNITKNGFRIQVHNSIIRENFCTAFIGFMLKAKSVLEYTNLVSPSEYKQNGKIILKYFEQIRKKLR